MALDLNQPGHLLHMTPEGLFCPAGGFHIDPWRPVARAVVTHAHSDHATHGCGAYLCAERGREVLAERVHKGAAIETARFGETRTLGEATVSLHPAGHILGSAQVCVEVAGERWVVTGDYKTVADPTCDPFEPVPCHTFITESTFGLPIYHWRPQREVVEELLGWWRSNCAAGVTSVLLTYALGKAQRVLSALASEDLPGPVFVHGALVKFNEAYAKAGVALARWSKADAAAAKAERGRALLIAPPSVQNTAYLRPWQPVVVGMASGWMAVQGFRRRRALDRGFVLSDHADWNGLLGAIRATGASRIGITHGQLEPMCRYLRECAGLDAFIVPTRFTGEALQPTSEDVEAADSQDADSMPPENSA